MVHFLLATSARANAPVWREVFFPLFVVFQASGKYLGEDSLFNILIALVFGFSTLNILGLATRRFENRRSRLNVGEILALTAMVLSVCFLGWEMLHTLHIFPIKLER
jgi:hypothetical protein